MSNTPSMHPGTASDERGYQRIRVRQDTLANWLKNDPILASGEFGFVVASSDPGQRLKIGDGTTRFSQLAFISAEGSTGQPGPPGESSTITVGTVTVLPAGSPATVTNSGTESDAILNFGIPTGPAGAAGSPGAPGAPGAAGATGSMGPQGPAGQSATVTVGTVSALPAGSAPTVVNSGPSSHEAVLDFGIPRGDKGEKGDKGDTGAQGPQGVPGSGDSIYKGEYNNGYDYQPGDVCRYNDRLYIRIGEANTGYPPGTSYWELWDAVAAVGLAWAAAPAAPTDAGDEGSVAYDSDYFYVAVAPSSWKRTQLSTWAVPSSPEVPLSLAATPGRGKAYLTWQAPQSEPAIVSYVIDYSTDGGDTWTSYPQGAAAESVSATIPNLVNGTEHLFRLAAVNSVGAGPFATATATPSETAFEPTALVIPAGGRNASTSQVFRVPDGATHMIAWAIGAGHPLGASGGWAYKQFSVSGGQMGEVTHIQNDRCQVRLLEATVGGGDASDSPYNPLQSVGGATYGGDGGQIGHDGTAQTECEGRGRPIRLPVSGITWSSQEALSLYQDQLRTIGQFIQYGPGGTAVARTSAEAMLAAAQMAGSRVEEIGDQADPALGTGAYYLYPMIAGQQANAYCYGPIAHPNVFASIPYPAGYGGGGVTGIDSRVSGLLSSAQLYAEPGSSAAVLYFYAGEALSFPPEPPAYPDIPPPVKPGTDDPPIPFTKFYPGGGYFIVPAGVTNIKAWAIGGGGYGIGQGGAGGGLAYKTWAVTPGQRIPITVGRAGSPDGKGAGASSVTVGSDTIVAYPGSDDGLTPGGFSGNAGGGATGTAATVSKSVVVRGGCISSPAGDATPCNRMKAADAGGLFAATAKSGFKTVEDCGLVAAVGSGGYASQSLGAFDAGYGGGGGQITYTASGSTTTLISNAGGGAVIIYAYGTGDPTDPPAQTLLAPRDLVATPGNGYVSLVWSPPISTGYTVTDYRIQYSANGGTTWLTQDHPVSTVTATTVSGLTNGVDYLFRVAAVAGGANNVVGEFATTASTVTPTTGGGFSPVARIVTETSEIQIPEGCTTIKAWAVGAGGAASVSCAGGTALSAGKGCAGGGGAIVYKTWAKGSGNTISVQISGLAKASYAGSFISAAPGQQPKGGAYTAGDPSYGSPDGGESGTHGSSFSGATGYPFDRASGGSAGGGNIANTGAAFPCYRTKSRGLSGLFDAVSLAGGKVVEDCGSVAAFGSGGSSVWESNTTGLKYKYSAGIGGGGALFTNGTSGDLVPAGGAAVVLLFTGNAPTSSPPGAPTAVQGTAGDAQVALSWTAPASVGGSAITDYLISRSSDGGTTWVSISRSPSTATTATITQLTNGVGYIFRVAAVNSSGAGAPSQPSAEVTPKAPITPPSFTPQAVIVTQTGKLTIPEGANSFKVWAVGAGSGATAASASGQPYTRTGGGAGACLHKTWHSCISGTLDITIGADAKAEYDGEFVLAKGGGAPDSTGYAKGGEFYPAQLGLYGFPDGGAAGGNGSSGVGGAINTGTQTSCGSYKASDVSGLFAAVALAGGNVTESCTGAPAFGTGAVVKVDDPSAARDAGYGGGGGSVWLASTNETTTKAPGQAVVVVYFFSGPALPPPAPRNVVGIASGTSVSLTWDAPICDRGSQISGYTVQYRSTTDSSWTTNSGSSMSPNATISNLVQGSTYIFRVRAINAAGDGQFSEQSSPVTIASPVQAIIPDRTYALNDCVILYWNWPPYSNLIEDVLTAEYSSNGGASWQQAFSLPNLGWNKTVCGLTTGSTYTFRIKRTTPLGSSDWASWPPVTLQPTASSVPPPTNVSATSRDSSVYLTWNKPASASAYSYQVQYSTNQTSWTQVSWAEAGESVTVTGLTNGTTYYMRVRAYDISNNYSEWASLPSPATPSAVPGAPTSLSATAGSNSVALTWSAPASTGGLPILDYVVEYAIVGSSFARYSDGVNPATGATVSGLQTGTQYAFRVSAVNASGTGSPCPTVYATTSVPPAVPGEPSDLVASAGNASISLTWAAPSSSGTQPITDYTVEYRLSSATTWTVYADGVGTATSATIQGLVNGSSYVCRVTAVSSVGAGSPAVSLAVTPKAAVPGAPTITSALAGSGSASIAWTAPASNGGASITSYTVQASTDGTSWSTAATTGTAATSATVAGLDGTGYSFRVAAQNSTGLGPYSAPFAATTVSAPAAPAAPTVTPAAKSASVSWAAPANGGSAITGFSVQWKKASDAEWLEQPAAASPVTLNNLSSNTLFEFKVAAINAIGIGPYSPVTQATIPAGAPSAPMTITATAGNGAVLIEWTAPLDDGGSPIVNYELQSQIGSSTSWTAVGTLAAVFSYTDSVANGTKVSYRVRAYNSSAWGAWAYSDAVTPEVPATLVNAFLLPQGTTKWARPSTVELLSEPIYTPNSIELAEPSGRVFVGAENEGKSIAIQLAENSFGDNPILSATYAGAFGFIKYISAAAGKYYLAGRTVGIGTLPLSGSTFTKLLSAPIITGAAYDGRKYRIYFMGAYVSAYPWRAGQGSSYAVGYFDLVSGASTEGVVAMDYYPVAEIYGGYPTKYSHVLAVHPSKDALYVLQPARGSVASRLFYIDIAGKTVTPLFLGDDIVTIAASPTCLFVQGAAGVAYLDYLTNQITGSMAGPPATALYWDNARQKLYAGGDGSLHAYDFAKKKLAWQQSFGTVGAASVITQASNGDIWGVFGYYVARIRPQVL